MASASVTIRRNSIGPISPGASQLPSPKVDANKAPAIGPETDASKPANLARSKAIFEGKRKQAGASPLLAGIAPQSAPQGLKTAASPVLSPASHAAPAPETQSVQSKPATELTQASTISGLSCENGILSFMLHIPAKVAGEPEQTYRISVLGGQRTDLGRVNDAAVAAYLTDAIALVQNNPKTAGFSAITFEGRLGDDALAKAVVQKDNDSFILGGNSHEKVVGSEKIFSDELQRLLNRLQETLTSRNAHLRVERHVPPATPATSATAPTTPGAPTEPEAPQILQAEIEARKAPLSPVQDLEASDMRDAETET